ncbi:MAG: hypothetical protein Q7R50_07145 [Dehalococcoidales bacterium]|nr:hypothetical protein [Dehalococcoidales bacterium]
MKFLAWYTIFFNLAIIALFILHAAGMVSKPPFSQLEDIVWAVFTVPVVILGIWAVTKAK